MLQINLNSLVTESCFFSDNIKRGFPQVTPVWVDMVGELNLINISEAAAKTRHGSKDLRVGLRESRQT